MVSDRRQTLLDAAVREIATHGTRGLRVERVAKLAGVSPALIYHHFDDRSALLQAALVHIGELADAYTTPSDSEATGRERLVEVVMAEIHDDENVRNNSTAWSELRNSAIFDDDLRGIFAELTERWVDDLADLVRDGQRDGSIARALDPTAVGIQLSALVEGVSGRWLCRCIDTDAARDLLAASIATIIGPSPTRALPATRRPRPAQ
jgi:AcrR family transcriptional regulator